MPARPVPDIAAEARAGLLTRPRRMPPKYFYDARGSLLFEQICRTPEYYPTRVEESLLERHCVELIERARPDHIIELGSGNGAKIRHLLAACEQLEHRCEFWPFDCCREAMEQGALSLLRKFPWLRVNALVGDYHGGLDRLPMPPGRRLFVFLGGTIGNFESEAAAAFLREVRGLMCTGDWFVLGADRVKSPRVLHAAYNDRAGVTAEFNLNLLRVLNRELQADFPEDAFEHEAIYHGGRRRIEMYLRARRALRVRVRRLRQTISLQRGERIRTEISRKFTTGALQRLVARCGMGVARHFEPPDRYFSLLLLRARIRARRLRLQPGR